MPPEIGSFKATCIDLFIGLYDPREHDLFTLIADGSVYTGSKALGVYVADNTLDTANAIIAHIVAMLTGFRP
jgi:hypothetical protein